MKPKITMRLMAALFAALVAGNAQAQHGHTMLVTSDTSGGGQLQLGWDFDLLPYARTSDSGLAGIFTGDVPGLDDGTGNLMTTFPLTNGTDIDVEITAIDESIRWIFASGTLDDEGEQTYVGTMPSLHNHATFEITGADDKDFVEGRISFRVVESTAMPVGYTPSDVHTLWVTNGVLPPLDLTAATADNLKCQKSVAGVVRKLTAKAYQILGKCGDAAYAATAPLVAGSTAAALKKCGLDTMDPASLVSKLQKEKDKAIEKIVKACGALSDVSVPYTESQIHTHLGLAVCRAEELFGATYNHAVFVVGDLLEAAMAGDHHTFHAAFPCIKASIE